jgi:hypothetical protein
MSSLLSVLRRYSIKDSITYAHVVGYVDVKIHVVDPSKSEPDTSPPFKGNNLFTVESKYIHLFIHSFPT